MVLIDVGNPKTARERLCVLQAHVTQTWMPENEVYVEWMQELIDQVDALPSVLGS